VYFRLMGSAMLAALSISLPAQAAGGGGAGAGASAGGVRAFSY
jgi:hypothetical protein